MNGADLNNGLLDIDLVRELPERMKPQQIAIGSGAKAKVIEDKKTKAAA